jgi:hypothetical protein
MKSNSFRRNLPYFFMHRIYHPESRLGAGSTRPRLERNEFDIKNMLRWEDDGGQITGWISPLNYRDLLNHKQMISVGIKEEK